MARAITRILLIAAIALGPTGCAPAHPPHRVADPAVQAWHLHLPGISGFRWIDRDLIRGLADGGFASEIEPYDWTTADPGLGSLLAHERNQEEAGKVSQMIESHYRSNPARRITITAHSGGAGVAVWALERLPVGVMVDDIVLLAPALSPTYDLSLAMAHVKGHVYAFTSSHDVAVLGWGTSMFGTIDGVKTEAAGKVGFRRPTGADATQYAKLIEIPYERQWMRYENIGDHIGAMNRQFAREIIAPLLVNGTLPAPAAPEPATMPVVASPERPAPPIGRMDPAATAK
jgi:pimeloyl-ACP methyl ester carboxylesterase